MYSYKIRYKKYIDFGFILFTLFICLLQTHTSLFAQNIRPNIPDTLYIGQVIPIEIDLSERQPERIFVQKDVQKKQLEIFDLLEYRDKPWHYLLRVAAFDTGYVRTEPIPLYLFSENRADTLYIEPFDFYVKSSLTLADTLMKDIAPPIAFRLKFWDYAVPILILLVLAAAIYFIPRLIRKKEIETEYVDNRPAWQIVMELLEKFKQKRLLEEGQYLDYYFELSLIFRLFIEKQHKVNAVEMTTSEIKQALPDIRERGEILRILNDMDKIKFAKFVPSIPEAEEILYWIEKYVMSFVGSSGDFQSPSPISSSGDFQSPSHIGSNGDAPSSPSPTTDHPSPKTQGDPDV